MRGAKTFACKSQECQWAGLVYFVRISLLLQYVSTLGTINQYIKRFSPFYMITPDIMSGVLLFISLLI